MSLRQACCCATCASGACAGVACEVCGGESTPAQITVNLADIVIDTGVYYFGTSYSYVVTGSFPDRQVCLSQVSGQPCLYRATLAGFTDVVVTQHSSTNGTGPAVLTTNQLVVIVFFLLGGGASSAISVDLTASGVPLADGCTVTYGSLEGAKLCCEPTDAVMPDNVADKGDRYSDAGSILAISSDYGTINMSPCCEEDI